MLGLPLAFAAPAVLAALIGLVGLYFLLRLTPPTPHRAIFPPLRLLIGLNPNETTPARTPWPILALRLAIGALIILAMAEPLWNSFAALSGSGPLLVLIDDGFAAAPAWDKRIDFARERATAAARSGRIVAIEPLSQGAQDIAPLDRFGVEGRLHSLAPVPYAPDRAGALPAIERFLAREQKTDILWIADGVELGGVSAFSARLASIAHSVEVVTDGRGALALAGVDNEAGALTAQLTRSDARGPATGAVRALDAQGQEVGRAVFDFGAKSAVDTHFDLPVELRNDVTQVVIDRERSAGATWLIDERSRRRRVAIASGASADVAQPLLAPSYYLRRALQPFADISEWHDSSTDPIVSLLEQKPSVLVLADMSVAPGPELDAITQFLDNGGALLRFAGTRLAAGDDTLTPTALRRGARLLGGALSWESPKHIAPFEVGSPFFGLAAPEEVTVTRQVLAEPETGLAEKTWARLADGTPLITAERRGKGLIVLDDQQNAPGVREHVAVVIDSARERGRRGGSGHRPFDGGIDRNIHAGLARRHRGRVVRCGNDDRECAAFPLAAPQLHGAAKKPHKLAGDRKAKTSAAIFAADRAVGLAEGLEHALLLLLRYADAGIGDRQRDLPVAGSPDRQFDLAPLGKLECVGQQVFQDLFEPLHVGVDRRGAFRRDVDFEGQLLFLRDGLKDLLKVLDQAVDRYRLGIDVHMSRLDLRQVENIVDQV